MTDLEFILGCAVVLFCFGWVLAALFVVALWAWRPDEPVEPAEFTVEQCEWRTHSHYDSVTTRRR